MNLKLHIICVTVLCLGLSGCTTLKNITGQNDDSVLPGQREDVLPPDQQTARDPIITGEQQPDETQQPPDSAQKCDPNDLNCLPPIDQESSVPEAQ
jgi:hypothetical protein